MESDNIERARLELLRAQHDLEREKVTADIEASKAASDLARSQFDAENSRPSYRASWPWLVPSLGFLGGVFGSVGAVYTGLLDVEVRDRAVDVQEMRIAFDMLQVPREQVGDTYRTWACSVLSAHSEALLDCTAPDALNADFSEPVRLSNLTIGSVDQGDAILTDIGLFVCSTSDEPAARKAAASLRDIGFGSISLRNWNLFGELPRESLTGRTTIVFDAGHPEQNEVPRIHEALGSARLGEVVEVENPAGLSRWYISVIVCDIEE